MSYGVKLIINGLRFIFTVEKQTYIWLVNRNQSFTMIPGWTKYTA